jgi:hypothetical protein
VNREPDDRAHPDAGTGGEREPEPDDFESIVDGWRREGRVPAWPGDDESPGPLLPEPPEDETPPAPADEGHFVPPEPPPLPRIGPPAAVGLALLCLGVVLIAHPALIGVPTTYGLPLGLLTLAAGLGWLVLRLWPAAPPRGDGDGPDDGAVL